MSWFSSKLSKAEKWLKKKYDKLKKTYDATNKWIRGRIGLTDETLINSNSSTSNLLGKDFYYNALNMLALKHQKDPDGTVISKLVDQTYLAGDNMNSFKNISDELGIGAVTTTGHRTDVALDGIDYNTLKTEIHNKYNIPIENIEILDTTFGYPEMWPFLEYTVNELPNFNMATGIYTKGGIDYEVTDILYEESTSILTLVCTSPTGDVLNVPVKITFPDTDELLTIEYSIEGEDSSYYYIKPYTPEYTSIPLNMSPIVTLRRASRTIKSSDSNYEDTKEVLKGLGMDMSSALTALTGIRPDEDLKTDFLTLGKSFDSAFYYKHKDKTKAEIKNILLALHKANLPSPNPKYTSDIWEDLIISISFDPMNVSGEEHASFPHFKSRAALMQCGEDLEVGFTTKHASKTDRQVYEEILLQPINCFNIKAKVNEITGQKNNLEDTTDVFLLLAMNIGDDVPVIDKLTYELFENLLLDESIRSSVPKTTSEKDDSGYTGNSTTIVRDIYTVLITSGTYNNYIRWSGDTHTIVRTKHTDEYGHDYWTTSKSTTIGSKAVSKSGSIGEVGTYYKDISGNILTLRKQTNETYYTEYEIIGISNLISVKKDGLRNTHTKKLSEVEIPLPMYLLDMLSPMEKAQLYPYVLKMQFYAAKVQHLEWYETKDFAYTMSLAIAIIQMVVLASTVGADGGSTTIILTKLLIQLATQAIVSYVMKRILASDAPDWLKALAVTTLVVVAIWAGQSTEAGEMLTASQLTEIVLASSTTVLANSAAIVSGLSNAYQVSIAMDMDELKEEQTKFNSRKDMRQKVVSDAYEHLQAGLDITQVRNLLDAEIPEPYLFGPDAFMFKAKGGIQYDYDALYDYSAMKSDFIGKKLQIGII